MTWRDFSFLKTAQNNVVHTVSGVNNTERERGRIAAIKAEELERRRPKIQASYGRNVIFDRDSAKAMLDQLRDQKGGAADPDAQLSNAATMALASPGATINPVMAGVAASPLALKLRKDLKENGIEGVIDPQNMMLLASLGRIKAYRPLLSQLDKTLGTPSKSSGNVIRSLKNFRRKAGCKDRMTPAKIDPDQVGDWIHDDANALRRSMEQGVNIISTLRMNRVLDNIDVIRELNPELAKDVVAYLARSKPSGVRRYNNSTRPFEYEEETASTLSSKYLESLRDRLSKRNKESPLWREYNEASADNMIPKSDIRQWLRGLNRDGVFGGNYVDSRVRFRARPSWSDFGVGGAIHPLVESEPRIVEFAAVRGPDGRLYGNKKVLRHEVGHVVDLMPEGGKQVPEGAFTWDGQRSITGARDQIASEIRANRWGGLPSETPWLNTYRIDSLLPDQMMKAWKTLPPEPKMNLPK